MASPAVGTHTPVHDKPSLLVSAAVLLSAAAIAWLLAQDLPIDKAMHDPRPLAEQHRLELENRLRLADRILRAMAADIATHGQDAAPLGQAEQRYFEAVTFARPGQPSVQLLPVAGTVPTLDVQAQQRMASGETVVVTQPDKPDRTAHVMLVREVAAAGFAPALLAARLAAPFLWTTAPNPDPDTGLCVRMAGGATLACSTPQAWQASTALDGDLGASIERLGWSAGQQSWQGTGAALRLASPVIDRAWSVLSVQPAAPPSARIGMPAARTLAWASVLALLAAAAFPLLRRRHTSPQATGPTQPGTVMAGPDAAPQTSDNTLQKRIDRQRHAIRAMADIDRASLSRASVERLVELAGSHLLLCTDADALTIAVIDADGLNRVTVLSGFAEQTESPAPQQQAIDDSLQQLLAAPVDGGWVHQLDGLPLVRPIAQGGIGSAFVLPIFQDGQPAGVIVLGCRDQNRIGADETSNARAIAGRLGATLTSLAREQALYAQTHFDATTALPNRQYLKEHLPQQISRARRDRARLALLFVDLDGFKKVNRVAGHSRGDLVLMETATRIRECLREEDLVVRFGGDEFVVVLPKVAAGLDARRVGEKLLAALARPYSVDGEDHQLGCSIGISIFPDDAQTVDAMLRNADSAMFDAKATGRGRFAFYDAAVNRAAIDRSALELELHHAIAHAEFVVYYQPQIDLRNGKIDGVEALVRWNHPTRGLISPYEFIAVAETSGLIEQIGEQVMMAACMQYRDWDAKGIAPHHVSVNVSSLEVTRGDIVGRIERVLTATGLRPMHLELELTEGVFLEESSGALEKLNELRRRGVRIAIDDFGTGYSSLGYLRRLPIDVVKIDQSFVRDLTANRDSGSIVRAVLEVAHSLGKQVVAEGVETEQHSTQLASMGCDVGQGYLWSRPLPADQFESFCRQWQALSRPAALEGS